jgi:hypothetical protein
MLTSPRVTDKAKARARLKPMASILLVRGQRIVQTVMLLQFPAAMAIPIMNANLPPRRRRRVFSLQASALALLAANPSAKPPFTGMCLPMRSVKAAQFMMPIHTLRILFYVLMMAERSLQFLA